MLYQTHAQIDLGAIHDNLAGIRERVGDRAVLAAVKANAYGHGAVAVAQMIQGTGVADWLGVATVPEALELRGAGIGLPILKLSHVFPEEIEGAIRAGLTLAVVDEQTIDQLEAGAAAAGAAIDVHLKLDTGMRRIGSTTDRAVELARRVDAAPHLRLGGLFTHHPVSDVASGVEFTERQQRLFADAATAVAQARGPVEYVHSANSGAILGHDLTGTTMVRPGIMIYGCYPDAETPRTIALQPALRLVSRVSFVKRISAGETVSYGRTWSAPSDTWIATVPIGYADGFSRLNSNRGRMLVNSRSYPIAGRVCMDQTMIDLGPADPGVRAGDEVVLIGRSGEEEITVDEVAELMGTINYEVGCLLTPRVTRVYSGA